MSSFRIAQFNILGRNMAGSMWFHYAKDFLPKKFATGSLNWTRNGGFPRTLLWEKGNRGRESRFYRFPVLLSEIKQLKADIICLVELDCFSEFQRALGQEGYDAVFTQRPGKSDGCGIFWRRDLFAPSADQSKLIYRTPANDRVALAQPLRQLSSGEQMIVVSTHFHWDQVEGYQADESKELVEWVRELENSHGDAVNGKIVLCGDLNATPGSETYEFLTSRFQDAVPTYEPGVFTSIKPDVYYLAKPRGMQRDSSATDEWHLQSGRSHVIDYVLFDPGAFEVERVPTLPRILEEGKQPVGFWAGSWGFKSSPAEGFDEHKYDPDWRPERAKGNLQLGIPNRLHGSDHLPVACTLRFRGSQAHRKRRRNDGADATIE